MNLDELREKIERECIARTPPGFVIPGIPRPKFYVWQYYLRRMIFNQEALMTVTREILKRIYQDLPTHQLAGMETAGPPIISALMTSTALPVNGFSIRKDQKKYGLGNWIEGLYDKNKPVILVDDLSNSKSTLKRAKEICEAHGMTVDYAVTIVDKADKDIDEQSGLKVVHLFNMGEFAGNWEDYYKKYPSENEMADAKAFIMGNQRAVWARLKSPDGLQTLNVAEIFYNAQLGQKFKPEFLEHFSRYGIDLENLTPDGSRLWPDHPAMIKGTNNSSA